MTFFLNRLSVGFDLTRRPQYCRFNVDSNLDLTSLTHILLISTKYVIPHLRQRTIAALQDYFPPTLKQFDSIVNRSKHDRLKISDLFSLANACRVTNVLIVLVPVLFTCSRQLLKAIVDGVAYNGSLLKLDPHNLRAVLLSRDHLCHLARSVTLSYLYYEEVECIDECMCAQRRAARRFLNGREQDRFVNPLSIFKALKDYDICDECAEAIEISIAKG